MMKRMMRTIITAIFVMAIALFGTLPQTAQLMPKAADEAYADTTYTVFIYSGKEGYFGEKGTTVKKITGNKYGEQVTVSLEDLDLKVKNPDEYYARGLKIAGHDNDELSSVQMQSYTFDIKEDTSFSVAYGMTGGMVKYTVNYRDRSGSTLRESEEFYGMPGDRPVVAFRHIDGYLPDAYNLTRRLTDSESSNVFNFTYHKVYASDEYAEGEDDGDSDGNGNNAAAGNGNGNAAAGTNAAGGTATADAGGGNNIPGTNITNLDGNDTPLAPGEDKEESGGFFSGINALMMAIIAAGIIIALLLLYFILRRRGEEE